MFVDRASSRVHCLLVLVISWDKELLTRTAYRNVRATICVTRVREAPVLQLRSDS